MTKPKTIQKFEESYDEGPRRVLKPGGVPSDLVQFESLGLGKLPSVLSSALDDYVLGFTEWLPTTAARYQHTEKALTAAIGEQKAADAKAVSELLKKGPEAFADLGSVIDRVDLVVKAQEAHEYASRTVKAVDNAVKGQMLYMNHLIGDEYRDAMLDVLDRSWFEYVLVSPTSETTLGELARLESVSTEGRTLIGRLLVWVEGQNRSRGIGAGELKLLRDALRSEDWNRLPTLERIEAVKADEAANSPEAKAKEAAEEAKAAKREEDKRYAIEAAKSRQARFKGVTANAEAARGNERPQENSGDDLVSV